MEAREFSQHRTSCTSGKGIPCAVVKIVARMEGFPPSTEKGFSLDRNPKL